MNDERWTWSDNLKSVVFQELRWAALIYAAILTPFAFASCAALRQNAEQARAGTVSAIEAPQRVESGATVVEALGAAVSANVEKTDKVADAVEHIDKLVQQQDSWSQRLAVAGLVGVVALGVVLDNRRDRRRFHRNGAESKGIAG